MELYHGHGGQQKKQDQINQLKGITLENYYRT